MGHQPSLERYSKTCYFSRQVSFVSKNPLHLGMGSMSTIFTIGKYFEQGEKILLSLAIQVHHGVCDGFHLSRFINDLQEWLDKTAEI